MDERGRAGDGLSRCAPGWSAPAPSAITTPASSPPPPASMLAGVYDVRREAAEKAAADHGTRACASLDELAGEIDAAVVAVPTVVHAEVGCRLLERGLHVLVEKPMAAGLAEADALLAAAAAGGEPAAGGPDRSSPSATSSSTTRRSRPSSPSAGRRASSRSSGCRCSPRAASTSTSSST